MLSKIFTATLLGLDCKLIEVEVDYRKGNSYFSIVGLPDKSVQESKERVVAAIKNSDLSFIPMVIVANLAPAELHKSGTGYDLPLALGYLLSTEQVNDDVSDKLFIGELALNGSLRPVHGILPITDFAKKSGFKEIYLPLENANEASLVEGIKVFGVDSLRDLVLHLNKETILKPFCSSKRNNDQKEYMYDMCHVQGQEHAKRAIEIAAAGGHNILLSGVPGSGKTLLSKCFPSILPEMTVDESLEVTRIYSVSGLTSKQDPLITTRPFRSPHHTSSQVALVGGGSVPKPGEISLAHRGVLFLDEFPEFSVQTLESLRQPLEDRIVTISRASATLTFPANFILVAAMNPCKCGYRGDPDKACTCSSAEVFRYQRKISGPIIDRIDMIINVPKVEHKKLIQNTQNETSEQIRQRVQMARTLQEGRYREFSYFSNAEIPQKDIPKFISLNSESKVLLDSAVSKLNLSARSYFRILRVARTIADLGGKGEVDESHIAEALSYRVEISS